MRIGSQGGVGKASEHLVVEVVIDLVDLTAGGLFDNAVRASHMLVRGLGNGAESRDVLKIALQLRVTMQLQRPAARGANPVFSGYVVGLDLAESRLGQEIAVLRVAQKRSPE